MKQYKIYGTAYELMDMTDEAIDSYAISGELVDDEPNGKFLGYVELEDGSIVSCYKKKNLLLPIFGLIILLGAAAAAVYFFVLPMFEKEVAIGGTMLQTDVGTNVVTFNGIMRASDGNIDIRFINGNEPATIQITGEGVLTEIVSVEPGESVEYIPVVVETADSVAEVTVNINSNGTMSTFNALVEIPDNNTDYDPTEGLNSYFEKELVIDEQSE